MANEDKIKIWIHIANLKPLELSVSRSDEPLLRSAEKNVNSLWEKWMNSFGASRSSEEVLAMVAFLETIISMFSTTQHPKTLPHHTA